MFFFYLNHFIQPKIEFGDVIQCSLVKNLSFM